jgi:hypothetical protein
MDEDIIYIFRNILEDSTVHRKHKNSILLLLEGYERQGWDIFEQYELDRQS